MKLVIVLTWLILTQEHNILRVTLLESFCNTQNADVCSSVVGELPDFLKEKQHNAFIYLRLKCLICHKRTLFVFCFYLMFILHLILYFGFQICRIEPSEGIIKSDQTIMINFQVFAGRCPKMICIETSCEVSCIFMKLKRFHKHASIYFSISVFALETDYSEWYSNSG